MDRRRFLKTVAGGATAAACGLAYAKDEPLTMEVWHEARSVDIRPFRATLQAQYFGDWYDVICRGDDLMNTTEWYRNGKHIWTSAFGREYQDDGTSDVVAQGRVVRLQLSMCYKAPEAISGVEVFS